MNTEDQSFTGTQPGPADTNDTAGAGGSGRPPLLRPARGRMVAGVAAAIAAHFRIDVTIVRVGFVVLTIAGFTGIAYLGGFPLYLAGIPLYLACWLLIPEEGCDRSILGGLMQPRSRQ